MSEPEKAAENGQAEAEAPPFRARIVITLQNDGNVNVQGPIHDLILSHGLMAAAARAINQNADRTEGGRLLRAAAPSGLIHPLRGD